LSIPSARDKAAQYGGQAESPRDRSRSGLPAHLPGQTTAVRFEGDDCIELDGTGDTIELADAPRTTGRVRLTLTTCEPRPERTPETIEANPIAVGD